MGIKDAGVHPQDPAQSSRPGAGALPEEPAQRCHPPSRGGQPRGFVAARSLLMTGIADVWASVQGGTTAEHERAGLILMVLSAAMFSLMAAMAKLLLPHTPTQAVVLSRGVMMTAVFVVFAARRSIPILGRRPSMLMLRGLLGYAALSCYFYSVQHLPLGDAVLLQYSHPAFVAALAPVLIGEKMERGHWPLVLMALAGVALIVGPSGELRHGALIGLSGSMLSGLAYMTVRELAKTEHPVTIMIWFPLMTIPGSLLATIHAGHAALPSNALEVLGHFAVFASALLGQTALTLGLVRVRAARATAISTSGPVFGLAFGWLIFGTKPSPTSLAGTALVLGALWLLARKGSQPAAAR
jgi:drug/metabolite transporter (DMT)-like permease